MRKFNFVVLSLVAVLLMGCNGGGGDGGAPAPADISGTWVGGGTVTYSYQGESVTYFANLTYIYENIGDGQYRATITVRIVELGIDETMQHVVFYNDGFIHYPEGSAPSRVRGNRIIEEETIWLGGVRVRIDADLYRTV